jgi:hypothetical protein
VRFDILAFTLAIQVHTEKVARSRTVQALYQASSRFHVSPEVFRQYSASVGAEYRPAGRDCPTVSTATTIAGEDASAPAPG